MLEKNVVEQLVKTYLEGTEYELITLSINAQNEILVEVDRLQGVDVDFCAELNHYLVEKLDQLDPDYALEVGSVSLTDPFRSPMQYEKHLGHDVEVLTRDGKKLRGQLVSVDGDRFTVDVETMVAVEGKKRKEKQMVSHEWQMDEVKYCRYDLKF